MSNISSIMSLYDTEKAKMLFSLKDSESNKCIKKFQDIKVTYVVKASANKVDVERGLQTIYADQGNQIKVKKVNIINVKPKKHSKMRRNARGGFSSGFKKAVVTFVNGHGPVEYV